MKTQKLEACPFCGSTDLQVVLYNKPGVVCHKCLALGPAAKRLEKDDAEKQRAWTEAETLWNKRAGDRKPEALETGGAEAVGSSDLLAGIDALVKPDYHALNVNRGRNDRLLHAVLCCYAKHTLDSDQIGWEQLNDILHSALLEAIGQEELLRWESRLNEDYAG
jgi:hypothetical protein